MGVAIPGTMECSEKMMSTSTIFGWNVLVAVVSSLAGSSGSSGCSGFAGGGG